MRLVLKLSAGWLVLWRDYVERRRLRQQDMLLPIRRWFCQQPVIRQPRGPNVVALTSYASRTTRRGANASGEYTKHGVLKEQDLRRG